MAVVVVVRSPEEDVLATPDCPNTWHPSPAKEFPHQVWQAIDGTKAEKRSHGSRRAAIPDIFGEVAGRGSDPEPVTHAGAERGGLGAEEEERRGEKLLVFT